MGKMSIKLNHELLYIRELTEGEKAVIDSALFVTPMLMCPDIGKIKETQEDIKITHAFLSQEGLNYGFDYADGKYSTKPASEIELINPKFDWAYIAKQNENR